MSEFAAQSSVGNKKDHSPLHLKRPDDLSSTEASSDTRTWYAINHYLGHHEIYKPDTKLTSDVQHRIDFLTDGRIAEAIVVHDESSNGFAMPGYVVVSDELLKLVQTEEELYGFLAHEITHIQRHHHDKTPYESGDTTRIIGAKRAHEAEADIIPLELLDKKGINPRGLLNLFKRLEDETKAQRAGKKLHWFEDLDIDVEHGSLIDRRLNIEEIARIIDIRNLSYQATPLDFTEDDFVAYQKDDELWQQFNQLDLLSKRQFLERQFTQINTKFNESSEEEKPLLEQKIQQLVTWQTDILRETHPDASDDQIETLLVLSLAAGYDATRIIPSQLLDTWTQKPRTREELAALIDTCAPLKIPDLGISLKPAEIQTALEPVLKRYLASREGNIDIEDYYSLLGNLPDNENLVFEDIHIRPPLGVLHERDMLTMATVRPIADALTTTRYSAWTAGLTVLNVSGVVTTREGGSEITFDELTELMRSPRVQESEEDRMAHAIADTLSRRVINNRFSIATNVQNDPLQPFHKFAFWNNQDFSEGYGLTHDIDRRDKMLSTIATQYSFPGIIEKLQEYTQNNDVPLSRQPFARLLVNAFSQGDEYDSTLDSDYTDRVKPSLRTTQLNSERFALWAICLDKTAYLHQVQGDINRLVVSNRDSRTTIFSIVNAIKNAPSRAKELGFPVDWEVTKEDFKDFEPLLAQAIKLSIAEAVKTNNPVILTHLLEELPTYAVTLPRETDENVEEAEDFQIEGFSEQEQTQWEKLVLQLLKHPDVTSSPEKLEQLLALACISDNPQVLLHVVPRVTESLTTDMDFDTAMEFLFERYGHLPRHIFQRALDSIIETKATTLDEFTRLETTVQHELEGFLEDNQTIGNAALADALLDPTRRFSSRKKTVGSQTTMIYGMDPMNLLEAMLNSGESDKLLKNYAFGRWWSGYRSNEGLRNYFNIETLAQIRHRAPNRQEFWTRESPPAGDYRPLSQIVTDTLLSSQPMRYAALRKVLVGKEGILENPHHREQLVEMFLSSRVSFPTDGGEKTTRDLLSALLERGDQEELYLSLNPILMDMVLKYPKTFYSYQQLAENKALFNLRIMRDNKLIPVPTHLDKNLLTKKLLSLMLAGEKEDEQLDLRSVPTRLLSLFPDINPEGITEKMSPWELALTVGEKSGAVGTRMLQLAGQYFTIPEEYHQRLMNAYDGMKGQSRLQAYRVLTREAETIPQAAALRGNIAEIHPRIGGGSLMTVYEVTMKDGSRKALAVRNPNVEYHLGRTISLLKETITQATSKNPDNKDYQLLGVLLDDVEQWIVDELNDPTFEEKDDLFRQQNDSRFSQFNAGRSRYKVFVPDVVHTGTRWLRCEDFVEGKNLTSLTQVEGETNIMNGEISKDDYRDVTSLLVSNYVYQLMATGLVHSDVHPGNFRITADNQQIAVFDRYNLLELNSQDKVLLKGLVTSFIGGGANAIRDRFIDYALTLPENQGYLGTRDELVSDLSSLSPQDDIEKTIVDNILLLKKRGLTIPLKISLIGKNLQALNRMSKEAGFTNIMQAYLHTQDMASAMKLFTAA